MMLVFTEEERPEAGQRMWNCGDTYEYPIPKPNGDSWEVVLNALLKKDKAQCDAWKDEVQNLLIFAGLFSAVVTSFVVQSYQTLSPDSSDLSVVLLARIALSLEEARNVTGEDVLTRSLLTIPSVTKSNLRVNTFWFLSLVLSLTTVLVGIVSLQWLREHQHYSDAVSPKAAIGIYHMRSDALRKWHVPEVFAALPLLLQAALVLFFAGIIDFLLTLAPSVATPVAIVVGATLLFLLLTTVLPALQCFFVSIRQPLSGSAVPSPCPYKSPQSLAFKFLLTLSSRIFNVTHELFVWFTYIFTVRFPQLFKGTSLDRTETWRYRLFSHRAYLFWASPHWIDFDRTWLILRNEHFDITRPRIDGERKKENLPVGPIYDIVRALATAVLGNEHYEHVIFASYHCFQDLSITAHEEGDYPNYHLQACYRDLVPTWNSPIANMASIVVDPSFELLHDIHSVLFLRLPGIFYKAINPRHILGKHMLELHTRILGNLLAHQPHTLSERASQGPTGFFHWYTINMDSLVEDPPTQDVFYEQFFFIFDSFIQTVVEQNDPTTIADTFHTHSDLNDFMSLAAFLTWRTIEKMAERNNEFDSSLSLLLSTLDLLKRTLNEDSHSANAKRTGVSDFLFCCSSIYLKRAWQERPPHLPVNQTRSPHLVHLLSLLGELQTSILPQYQNHINIADFSQRYGHVIDERSLPGAFLKTHGQNFLTYLTDEAVSRIDSRRTRINVVHDHHYFSNIEQDKFGDGPISLDGITATTLQKPESDETRTHEQDGVGYNPNADGLV